MFKRFKIFNIYLSILVGAIGGLAVPIIFIFLDLKQLGLSLSFTNIYEIFKSQNIYIFSSILFPLLFGTVAGLFFNTFSQNKKMAEQENYIKSILNSLIDCIVVCNSEGKIQYANRIYYNTYGDKYPSIGTLFGLNDLSTITRGQYFEMRLVNKNGDNRYVNYSIYDLKNKKNESLGNNSLIVSIRDINESKNNEEIIESQTALLFEASKLSALGEMASGFAHEINNPLTVINGKLMLAEREIKQEVINKDLINRYLASCKENIFRITKIITGLRNLSHANISEIESIKIKDLVEDSMVLVNLKISGKGIDFIVDIASVENETIICNPIQISQVLMNLFGNAMDAIDGTSHPWLMLKIESNEQEFKLIIMDSGKGIPLEVQKRIFDPMFTTKPVGKGTGLGLSISRSIIKKHKGEIIINNDCLNTCFEITLPKSLSVSKVAA